MRVKANDNRTVFIDYRDTSKPERLCDRCAPEAWRMDRLPRYVHANESRIFVDDLVCDRCSQTVHGMKEESAK